MISGDGAEGCVARGVEKSDPESTPKRPLRAARVAPSRPPLFSGF